jgi:predicted signal transduction protein with EAL and GGDEF domain
VQKIDLQSASEDTAIVRSIIVMGRNLGLEVIAEGRRNHGTGELSKIRRLSRDTRVSVFKAASEGDVHF